MNLAGTDVTELLRTRESADFDQHVRALMQWHFDPRTGSKFWLDKRDSLGFDPIEDVQRAQDLLRFPDCSEQLRTAPVPDLIPRALRGNRFRVYESGGTTGAPKRIVDGGYRSRLAAWAKARLSSHGVPTTGHWLHLGPTGPHVVGFDTANYAGIGDGLCYAVDLDPRWVKRLIGSDRSQLADEYVAHVLDQAVEVLRTQPIAVLSTTPPLIEAICARPELYELVRSSVEAIVWAGTAVSPETLRQIETTFFPDAHVVGVYGNSLMGVAPQRPREEGDEHGCVFEPFPETTRLDLVDEHGEPVAYGERGRVRLHLVSEEMFLPNVWERDTAIRVEPRPDGQVDGLAGVRSDAVLDSVEVIEGVY